MQLDFHRRGGFRLVRNLALGIAATLSLAAAAAAQDTPPYVDLPLYFDSGSASNTGNQDAVVIAFPIKVPAATWVRLYFETVELSGNADQGTGSILRITSLYDANVQYLNSNHVEQWYNSSCYFNGDELLVEIVSQPNTGPNRIVLKGVSKGLGTGQDSQCGPTDDRILSGDGRACRLLPIGCTGWIIDDCRSCLLTAGHCSTSSLQTAEFNVPLSTAGGTLVHPPPSDQYSVDVASKLTNGGQGVGNDWGYFGCFPNSNTGLTPFGKQLARFHFALPPPFNASQTIRITGYGTDSGTSNQVQQTHIGPWVTLGGTNGTTIQYRTDTTGGNSGSPVAHGENGDAIGIHTHGGCQTNGTGENSGTASMHPGLQAALAAPIGVCGGASPCNGVGNTHCIPGPLMSVISGTGSASIAANDLVLHANNIGVGKPGLFIYSQDKQNIAFPGGTGRLCVGGASPIARTTGVNSGAGTTFTLAVDYNALPPSAPITAGSIQHFQAWFRTTPGSSETSNGLTITFTP